MLLEKWLSASEANKALFDELVSKAFHQTELPFFFDIDTEKAWSRLAAAQDDTGLLVSHEAAPAKRRLGPWLWAAAAAVITGFYLVKTLFFIPPAPQASTHEILPGDNRATLTLSDGTVIPLSSVADGGIASQGNVTVVKLDGMVQYQPKGESNELVYNTIQTPKGGKYQLVLSDGTVVWLNASSSLRFPNVFNGTDRNVELKGEGFFDVSKNAKKPFKVKLEEGAEIEVFGTSFNIKAYQDEQMVRATLIEGKIGLSIKGMNRNLVAGQQARIMKGQSAITVVDGVEMDEVVGWKNDLFVFKSLDIQSIMRQISRWYDVEVVYAGELSKETFSGVVSAKSNLSQVLKILEEGGVAFKIEGRKIIVK
jgi:ferric-dicitrate binding protein FerR (iron transport regulator)